MDDEGIGEGQLSTGRATNSATGPLHKYGRSVEPNFLYF